MRRSILLLPLCVAVAALSGCGNKGPLFMPPPKPTPANTVPPSPKPTPTITTTTMPPAPAASAAQPASR
ncbi:LPS translocon maturation chaperone LptM [Dyella sp. 2RAB6]|uniref:LPS translocon maturation chaperone LptM n=1 Tax=Dyella sp. 2RAB6 TaxID=3232992 RepID=UPI003F8ECB48